jgi:hypothetical protein
MESGLRPTDDEMTATIAGLKTAGLLAIGRRWQ